MSEPRRHYYRQNAGDRTPGPGRHKVLGALLRKAMLATNRVLNRKAKPMHGQRYGIVMLVVDYEGDTSHIVSTCSNTQTARLLETHERHFREHLQGSN